MNWHVYLKISGTNRHIIDLLMARLKCVTGYAEMSNDLTDCLDFDYQQTHDPTDRVTYLFLFFNVPFSLFLGNSLLDFEMGKVKVFFFMFYCYFLF